ncbi:MAG: PAS domain S-box protein [Gemmatimonadales bacterium]|nr:PAS domain S-box protein [Gemmatimonadales bacterium]
MPLQSIPSALLDAFPAEAVVLDAQGTIVACNARWKQSALASGWWSADAGLGSNYLSRCRAATGPDAGRYPAVAVGIDRVLAGDTERFELEYALALPGEARHYRLTAASLAVNQAIEGVLILHEDISATRRAEQALLRSEERFATLASEVPVGIFQTDPAGGCLYVNRRWREMTGLTDQEAMGHGWASALHPDDRAWLFETWSRRALTAEPFLLEYRYRHRDGRVLWVVGSATPLRDANGTLAGYLGSVTDITERRSAEEALQEAHAHLQALLEACPLAIVEVDGGGRVVSWSPAAERLFGWRFDEVIGRDLPVVPEEKQGEFGWLRARASTADPVMDFETYRRRRDGTRVEVSLSVAPVHGTAPDSARYLGLYTDITPRKRIERELERSRELLREAQKMEAVGRLAGGIAHDFNNLLTAILGYCELLGDEVEGPAAEMVQEIRRGSERAALLTGQLLAFSRKQILQPVVLDLEATVRGLELMTRRLLGERRNLVMEFAPTAIHVYADRGQLEQVIVNLVINARDAMPNGGTLIIRTEKRTISHVEAERQGLARAGEAAALLVRDNGVGMSPETMAHLFEPFFTTKPVGQGTGLGLATADGIIRQSGGIIAVESAAGQGSAFTVLLPLERRAATRLPPQPDRASSPVEAAIIMIVDDDASVRRPLQAALERWGYTVIAAADGAEALQLIERASVAPDLVVSDVVMPEMDGAELAAALRRSHPELPVLFMSGYNESEVLRHGVGQGIVKLIRKPFGLAELNEQVRQILATAHASRAGE